MMACLPSWIFPWSKLRRPTRGADEVDHPDPLPGDDKRYIDHMYGTYFTMSAVTAPHVLQLWKEVRILRERNYVLTSLALLDSQTILSVNMCPFLKQLHRWSKGGGDVSMIFHRRSHQW